MATVLGEMPRVRAIAPFDLPYAFNTWAWAIIAAPFTGAPSLMPAAFFFAKEAFVFSLILMRPWAAMVASIDTITSPKGPSESR